MKLRYLNKLWKGIGGGALMILMLTACQRTEPKSQTSELPDIFPDYVNTTIPCNMAPLNFGVEDARKLTATFYLGDEELFYIEGEQTIDIPERKWKKALAEAKGKSLRVRVAVWNEKYQEGMRFHDFSISVSSDSITPWIAYRLIPPGYVQWNRMGIYQRHLESFEEQCIVSNAMNDKGCVNCHTFNNYSPDRFLFHARGKKGCSVLVEKGEPQRVELDKIAPYYKGTYPYWHPEGRFLVLANCDTHQGFYGESRNKVEVYDLESDLMIYDTKYQKVITDGRFTEKGNWETFPSFSPDGKYLYFCSAKACKMPVEYEKLQYALLRVAFNPEDGTLGEKIDTIYNPEQEGGSVSFPRISPDGQYLMFTESDFGTFPIWHKQADLQTLDLKTGLYVDSRMLNSDDVESYHSWDAHGKWVIFSSRRMDGRYTRLYIAHFVPGEGFSKPFLLPQKNPEQNWTRIYSYNIPEFIQEPVELSEEEVAELFR